jgi:nickel-type superoxide dismutase
MFDKWRNAEFEIAEAHCDGPCGVYDPSQARIEAESVLQLTKKILDLKMPDGGDAKASAAYQNTLTRFIAIKEERAELAKHHLLVLWTDYFKPATSRSTRSFMTCSGNPRSSVRPASRKFRSSMLKN